MNIKAHIGFGPKVSGEIVTLKDEEVHTHQLSMDLGGKIIVSTKWVSREFLQKADFVGVLGVVVPSIHYRDYEHFKSRCEFSLLVLEKFGKMDLPVELVKKLSSLSSGTLDGEEKTLTT